MLPLPARLLAPPPRSGGIKGSLLIPEAPFELLVRRAIERLLPPALQVRAPAAVQGGAHVGQPFSCQPPSWLVQLVCVHAALTSGYRHSTPLAPSRPPANAPARPPQCKDFVHSELLRIASQCAPPEVKRFQILGVSG